MNNYKVERHAPERVDKPWGYELIIHNSEEYCGKLLVFPRKDWSFTMHYHLNKAESWYIQSGRFLLEYIDTELAIKHEMVLTKGDCVDIFRGQPHRLIALEDNSVVFEVSTQHFNNDSYRIER